MNKPKNLFSLRGNDCPTRLSGRTDFPIRSNERTDWKIRPRLSRAHCFIGFASSLSIYCFIFNIGSPRTNQSEVILLLLSVATSVRNRSRAEIDLHFNRPVAAGKPDPFPRQPAVDEDPEVDRAVP